MLICIKKLSLVSVLRFVQTEGKMVRIPKTSSQFKKNCPNKLNNDGSIMINNEVFHTGDTFEALCIRKSGTTWGWQLRNAKILSIEPVDDLKSIISVEGSSDWKHVQMTCELKDII